MGGDEGLQVEVRSIMLERCEEELVVAVDLEEAAEFSVGLKPHSPDLKQGMFELRSNGVWLRIRQKR
ncbi:MAG: hypothetical protein P4L10_01460 [Acidobacteriaceae bacterium]|nr:hypothetical protein [Acidobacteriaceae bacterium]